MNTLQMAGTVKRVVHIIITWKLWKLWAFLKICLFIIAYHFAITLKVLSLKLSHHFQFASRESVDVHAISGVH